MNNLIFLADHDNHSPYPNRQSLVPGIVLHEKANVVKISNESGKINEVINGWYAQATLIHGVVAVDHNTWEYNCPKEFQIDNAEDLKTKYNWQ